MEESIAHAFFHCPVIQPLFKLLEGYIVCVRVGKFFVLEANSVCNNVVLSLYRLEHYVFLYSFGIMNYDLDNATEGKSFCFQ